MSGGADVIDTDTLGSLRATVEARLAHDSLAGRRRELRSFYFGDLQVGESTTRFLEEVDRVIEHMGKALAGRARTAVGADSDEPIDEPTEGGEG